MSGRVEAVGPCAVRSKLNKFEHVQGGRDSARGSLYSEVKCLDGVGVSVW